GEALSHVNERAGNDNQRLRAELEFLEGMEAWYENPKRGVEVLQHSLSRLAALSSQQVARIAAHLANVLIVDEDLDELAKLRPQLEELSKNADESDAAMLRLAVAEITGDWYDIAR